LLENSQLPLPLDVSVVVPVLNGAETIGATLTALANQAGAPRAGEIIVVDNGSTDGTPALVRRFDVTLLTESKRGPSAARNRGLAHARGEVVAFLDADTLPTRRWLAELGAPFADANVLVVGGETVDYIAKTPTERFMSQMGAFAFEYALFRRNFPHVSSCNMAVRRSAAVAIQGWDESFFTAEDFDFTLRLVRHFGCPVVREPRAVLMNRHRTTKEALQRQAWTYGEGMCQIHMRYPEIGDLNTAAWLKLMGLGTVRGAKAVFMPLAHQLGLTSAARAEFARYHWVWSWWFWRGYISMLRHKKWVTV
jgi:glycosyltransferase involved in cell wall biosynthesis